MRSCRRWLKPHLMISRAGFLADITTQVFLICTGLNLSAEKSISAAFHYIAYPVLGCVAAWTDSCALARRGVCRSHSTLSRMEGFWSYPCSRWPRAGLSLQALHNTPLGFVPLSTTVA